MVYAVWSSDTEIEPTERQSRIGFEMVDLKALLAPRSSTTPIPIFNSCSTLASSNQAGRCLECIERGNRKLDCPYITHSQKQRISHFGNLTLRKTLVATNPAQGRPSQYCGHIQNLSSTHRSTNSCDPSRQTGAEQH